MGRDLNSFEIPVGQNADSWSAPNEKSLSDWFEPHILFHLE